MDLFEPLNQALKEQKYTTPTPIQQKTIPPALDGKDILGCAQTGTGKTAAFALPILDFIGHEQPRRMKKSAVSLVLAPTRELAIQIADSFEKYGKHMRFSMATVYGGVNQRKQVNAMRQGVDVLIATPGRLLDLIAQKHIRLDGIEILVLDEADRMLDMGFMPDLKKIIGMLPDDRQSLFFSATLPKATVELANRLLFNPVHVKVATKPADVKRISQSIRMVSQNGKFSALRQILKTDSVERAIVFSRTKRGANRIAKKLNETGIGTAVIHGNKSQNARQKALENFRAKRVSVLVATDVASRGIDIDKISHVINYDLPIEPECYVHRIGRTGRAGLEGVAISLCSPNESKELRAIERLLGKKIPRDSASDARQPRENVNKKATSKPRRNKNRSVNAKKKSTGRPANQPGSQNKKRSNNQNRKSSGEGSVTYFPDKPSREKAGAR